MIDKNELLKLLPKLIREDDEIKGAIITALSGVVATKEDIARLIDHSNRRFDEINKRFEESNRRFESMDKRFESMDKRFESMDKRFEELIKEIDRRFEAAAKERKDIQDSMIILRETVGEVFQKVDTIEKDVKDGNEEILDYLRNQFEKND
ncbi:MAG: hypothetical protein EU529_09325 [Promethearchaeota archaeon]|nr:MAG: hypothetical protein EU529_09325 [Candidatus Lokiarchaeota archaeon]